MADFALAVAELAELEGGYVNRPDDPGGETKFGISKRSYPHLDIAALTLEDAQAIYHRDYWLRLRCDEIDDQDIATKLLSFGVVMGKRWGVRCLQRALRAARSRVVEDGYIGPKTIAAANDSDGWELLAAFKSEGAGRFRSICQANPSMEWARNGWMNRAYGPE